MKAPVANIYNSFNNCTIEEWLPFVQNYLISGGSINDIRDAYLFSIKSMDPKDPNLNIVRVRSIEKLRQAIVISEKSVESTNTPKPKEPNSKISSHLKNSLKKVSNKFFKKEKTVPQPDAREIYECFVKEATPIYTLYAADNGFLQLLKDIDANNTQDIKSAHTRNKNTNELLLHYAAKYGNVEMTKYLCQTGCEIDGALSDEEYKRTPLHLACQKGHSSAVRVLLDNGAKINHTDTRGVTPLHLACFNLACCNTSFLLPFYLISRGANPSLEDYRGRKPLDVLRKVTKNELKKQSEFIKFSLSKHAIPQANAHQTRLSKNVWFLIFDLIPDEDLLNNTRLVCKQINLFVITYLARKLWKLTQNENNAPSE